MDSMIPVPDPFITGY